MKNTKFEKELCNRIEKATIELTKDETNERLKELSDFADELMMRVM